MEAGEQRITWQQIPYDGEPTVLHCRLSPRCACCETHHTEGTETGRIINCEYDIQLDHHTEGTETGRIINCEYDIQLDHHTEGAETVRIIS